MLAEAPPFWWQAEADWRATALTPLSLVYAAAAGRRLVRAPREKVALPVLCVGNFTVGGSGKTPVAIALARRARAMKLKPGFLSRGHGGNVGASRIVDPVLEDARHAGDEPLLLAAHAPVAVSPDRAAGARLLAARGCDFLIMDDGFQSARIHMDYALLVVDAGHGVGNGRVLPAGPLRARVVDQLRHADAVLRMGEGTAADPVVRQAARAGKPVYDAVSRPRDPDRFAGRRFMAFAGIGHPEKFFAMLRRVSAEVAVARPFPDHHFYTTDELRALMAEARTERLTLVTTAKDMARLSEERVPAGFLAMTETFEIDAVFDSDAVPRRIIDETLRAWRRR
jgi:tetraacyldisaccharide 4'-kinase